MNDEKIVVNIPNTNIEIVNNLAKSYVELKQHEFISIVNKINSKNYNFKVEYEENTCLNYYDLHIILYYTYGYLPIREDKFFHILDNSLIDITHFMSNTDELKETIKIKLKEYKIKTNMIDLVLLNGLDNFFVHDDCLEFIYSLNQFGISSTDEIRINISIKDYYHE